MDFIQGLAGGGLAATVVGALGVLIKLILDKRMRTPADQQSETMNVFTILSKTIEDNRTDKATFEATIADLRIYAEKADTEARQDQQLILSLNNRIGELEDIIRVKNRRIDELEHELAKHAGRIGGASLDGYGQPTI